MSDLDAAVTAYVAYWEALSPGTVDHLDGLAVPDFRFVDPFQDIVGRDRAKRAFAATFTTTDEPRFRVTDRATSGRTAYLRWTFTFRPKGRAAVWTIEGMSEVAFDAEGQALSHIDHWDAGGQFYARLPVLGTLIRLVKRRLAH